MSDHVSGLAHRFKAAMVSEQERLQAVEAAKHADEASKKAREEARAVAWKQLCDDLVALASEVGVLSVVRQGDSAVITRDGARNVRFSRGPEGVFVEIAGVRAALVFDEGTWDLVIDGQRRPFWDEGAVFVLTEGLGLPMPEVPVQEPAPAVAAPVAAAPVTPAAAPAPVTELPAYVVHRPATPAEAHEGAESSGSKRASNSPPGSALKELKPLW